MKDAPSPQINTRTQAFLNLVRNPLKFSLYTLWRMPSAWLAGVRVTAVSTDSCTTMVPYRWLSQNPFRSTYFACLSMAAELSTGVLAMLHVNNEKDRISMLVTSLQADFHKKAKGKTWFTCSEGALMQAAVQRAASTGAPETVTVQSTGKSEDGTLIATFAVTWSFRKVNER